MSLSLRLKDNRKIINILDKIILINLYIFSLGLATSKSLISIGMGLAIIFWILKIIFTSKYDFYKSELFYPILIFLVGILISGIDLWEIVVLDEASKFIFAILVFFLIINEINNKEEIKRLFYVSFVSMSIASLYGFYQFHFLNYNRAEGFMLSLAFAGFLSIFLMFTISYLFWGKKKLFYKIILLITTIFFLLNLLYTKSRGAWLGFIAALLSLTWFKNPKLIFIVILVLIIIPIFLPDVYINRFKSIFNISTDRSNLTRLSLWKGSLFMLKDNVLNGVGFGKFQTAFEQGYNKDEINTTVHAHNNILQFAAETGLIGLSAFLWLMFSILKLLYQKYLIFKQKNKWDLFILSTLAGFIMFNIQGLTEYNIGDYEPLFLFWFLIALNVSIFKNIQVK